MDSKSLKSILNSNLPEEILPGKSYDTEESKICIKSLLTQNLPNSDRKNLASDVKWKFLLDKHSFQKKKIAKKKTFLTRRQRKDINLLKLPGCGWSYSSLQGLREMWKEYMKQNLDPVSKTLGYIDQEWNYLSTVVAKSELIGAELSVIQSKILNQVGMTGTVVLETKMTFNIVTTQSKLKTIVKDSAVFQFQLDNIRFIVFGKYIATRPSERSVKKIKRVMVPHL